MWRQKLMFLVFVTIYRQTEAVCRESYLTFCDNFADLDYEVYHIVAELVVGSESGDTASMTSIDSNILPLKNFTKLRGLTIVGQINDIKTNTFNLRHEDLGLDYLKFYGNNIRRLRSNAFDRMEITRFIFTNNNLEYIQKQAFYHCNFETIDLSYNKLETIESNVFSDDTFNKNNVVEIIIKFNRIENIEAQSLPSSLEVLNLDYNNISVLNNDVFKNLHKLREFTLSHNKLKNLPEVKQFTNINILDLSYNEIQFVRFDYFNNLTELNILNLNYNKISNGDAFKSVSIHEPYLLQIYLAFNRLTYLDLDNSTFGQYSVVLYGNPWNCKCWETMERFMADNNIDRDECDLQYFGNGESPYCVHYSGDVCVKLKLSEMPSFSEKSLNQFLQSVENVKNKVKCHFFSKAD